MNFLKLCDHVVYDLFKIEEKKKYSRCEIVIISHFLWVIMLGEELSLFDNFAILDVHTLDVLR